MTLFGYTLGFAYPWALLGILVWPLLPKQRGWLWRALATGLLLVAVAQPSLTRSAQRVVVVVEASDGVGMNAINRAKTFDLSEIHPYSTLLFAENSTVTELSRVQARDRQTLETGGSDVARALQVARAGGAERILLVASGAETSGNALSALPDVPIDVHPVATVPNARVLSLHAPEEVSPGERFTVTAIIESDRDTELTLTPSVNGETLEPQRERIQAGRTSLSFEVTAEGREGGDTLTVEASIEVAFEQPRLDDSQRTDVRVREPRRVLVIGDPVLADLLEAQGFEVSRGSPQEITSPIDAKAVIIREHADAFSRAQLNVLADFVERGGGLMMSGGENSFGLGGWYRTPVDELLPVDAAVESELERPQVAVVLVFDYSGSMRAERPSRISLARQGARNFVENAHQDDQIGLIAFDHEYEWFFRPRPATSRGKLEMNEAISRLEPQGGTIVGPAYREAIRELEDTDAAIRHIILLTDGEFFDGTGMQGPTSMGPRPDFEQIASDALTEGITTTTIGFGEADFDVIERIARAGGGRFYGVTDTTELPQILTDEAITTARSSLREEPFSPTVREHPFTAGLGTPPPLDGYITSTLKESAELLFEGLDEEPVLALKRHGLGRTAALTTDLNSVAGEFGRWPELTSVLSRVTRWLASEPERHSVSLNREGDGLRVVLDAVRDAEYVDGERYEARYRGSRVELSQVAPGRYEGFLDAAPQGGSVVITRGNETVTRAPVTLPNPLLDAQGGLERLQEIAERSGGQVYLEPTRYQPPPTPIQAAVWSWFALAGLGVFGLELLVRRFRPSPTV